MTVNVLSDKDGRYHIENLPAGKYYISMTATNSAGVESAPATEASFNLT